MPPAVAGQQAADYTTDRRLTFVALPKVTEYPITKDFGYDPPLVLSYATAPECLSGHRHRDHPPPILKPGQWRLIRSGSVLGVECCHTANAAHTVGDTHLLGNKNPKRPRHPSDAEERSA